MDLFPSAKEQIEAEAVEWFLRWQQSEQSSDDHKRFSEWLTRSPIHVQEYLAVSSTWVRLTIPSGGDLATDKVIAAARGAEPFNVHTLDVRPPAYREPHRENAPQGGRQLQRAVLAATLLLGCAAWVGYANWYRLPVYRTAVGEQRSVTLADGSIIVLNTHSEVRVHLTARERHVELIRGEAQFHVAKNPNRPFWVATPDVAVRAVGTVFNVRDEPSGTQVAVLEGRVEMSTSLGATRIESHRSEQTSPAKVDLAAGQRAAVTPHGIERDAGTSVEAAAGWTDRRLVFRDQRLAEVVAEFNRYRERPLIVDDSELADMKISGVFDASDPESLVLYLKSFESVHVELPPDGSMHLLK